MSDLAPVSPALRAPALGMGACAALIVASPLAGAGAVGLVAVGAVGLLAAAARIVALAES